MANKIVVIFALCMGLGMLIGCSSNDQAKADVVDLKAKPTMPPPTASAGGVPAKPAATAQVQPQ